MRLMKALALAIALALPPALLSPAARASEAAMPTPPLPDDGPQILEMLFHGLGPNGPLVRQGASKYLRPIHVSVGGNDHADHMETIRTAFRKFGGAARHPMDFSQRQEATNYWIVIAKDMGRYLRTEALGFVEFAVGGSVAQGRQLIDAFEQRDCAFVNRYNAANPSEIVASFVFITSPPRHQPMAACIDEMMLRSMGVSGVSPTITNSILSSTRRGVFATGKDLLALRILYHAAIKPGASQDEVRAGVSPA